MFLFTTIVSSTLILLLFGASSTPGVEAATTSYAQRAPPLSLNQKIYFHIISASQASPETGSSIDATLDTQISKLTSIWPYFKVNFARENIYHAVNPSWAKARPGSRAEKEMKKTLRRGGYDVLNLYITESSHKACTSPLRLPTKSQEMQDGCRASYDDVNNLSDYFVSTVMTQWYQLQVDVTTHSDCSGLDTPPSSLCFTNQTASSPYANQAPTTALQNIDPSGAICQGFMQAAAAAEASESLGKLSLAPFGDEGACLTTTAELDITDVSRAFCIHWTFSAGSDQFFCTDADMIGRVDVVNRFYKSLVGNAALDSDTPPASEAKTRRWGFFSHFIRWFL